MDSTTTGAAEPSHLDPSPEGPSARPRRRRWAVVAVVLGPLLLAGCKLPSFGAYRGATTQAQDTFKLWQLFVIAGIVVGGIVFLLILFTVLRYRRKGEAIPKQTQYHTLVEILYTVLPIVIVLGLFAATVFAENSVTAVKNNPGVKVKVTAFQWGWEFQYPGLHVPAVIGAANIIAGVPHGVPTMVVPTGETVQIHLVSKDVIHGFYVPAFNFSRYAQPGFNKQYFDFNVIKPGLYRGQCTQLCGLYHSVMLFNVRAMTPAQFRGWVSQHQATSLTSQTLRSAA